MSKKIINIILWILVILWIIVCLTDYYKTNKREEPIFIIKHNTNKYEDGIVDSYMGLGYKIYHYKRKCINGYEYGPFWSKDRSIDYVNCGK